MNRAVPPFVFVICVSSVIDLATDTPSDGGHWLGPFFQLMPATQATSACCAAALILLTLFMLFGRSAPIGARRTGGATWTWLLWLLPAASMGFAFFWTRALLDSAFVIPWNAMVIVAPLLLCVSAFKRWPAVTMAGMVAAVGIAVRLVHFARFSIDEGADMLPLTHDAIARFLTGNNPYIYYNLPTPVPLTYYPLTWLAFLPAYVAHVDLRWTNIAAEMAILAAIVSAGRVRGKALAPTGEGSAHVPLNAAGAAVLAWSFQFLLPSTAGRKFVPD